MSPVGPGTPFGPFGPLGPDVPEGPCGPALQQLKVQAGAHPELHPLPHTSACRL